MLLSQRWQGGGIVKKVFKPFVALYRFLLFKRYLSICSSAVYEKDLVRGYA